MRYWWVSQNQTFDHEVPGGYMWSPKVNRDGLRNHFYETMREVAAGDIIFSFNDRKIMALGVVLGSAYTCPKPVEFGSAGAYWNEVGWRVDVDFKLLINKIEPRSHMPILRQLLPEKYSPIRADGTGNQIYLAELPAALADVLLGLIGVEGQVGREAAMRQSVIREADAAQADSQPEILTEWDKELEKQVSEDPVLSDTEKRQVIRARRGQGLFKKRVSSLELRCRITRVDRVEHLIASHIKPWRVATNEERLDGENGLMLTPTVDHLFDEGFISFRNNGGLILSPVADRLSLEKMGIPLDSSFNVGGFTRKQTDFLEYHRDFILHSAKK